MIPSIERDILIEAPVDVVWRAVTEPSQITNWFSDEAELDLHPGGEGKLTFEDKAVHQPVVVKIRVESVEPERRFAYRWSSAEGVVPRQGNSILVEFTLTPEGAGTRLRVTETGLDDLGWTGEEKAKYVRDHTLGWIKHLGDLGEYAAKASSSR